MYLPVAEIQVLVGQSQLIVIIHRVYIGFGSLVVFSATKLC